MTDIIIEGKALNLTVRQTESQIRIAVEDRFNQRCLPEVDLCHITVFEKMERRERTIRQFRIDLVQREGNEIHVILGHEYYEFSIGLWIGLDEEALVLRCEPVELYNRLPEITRVFRVDCLWGMMSTDPGGDILLPLQSGMLCKLDNVPRTEDRFMIYGEQSYWELLPTLPFCAVHSADGGMMALATKGAAETECRVLADGKGGGQTSLNFCMQQFWPDPVDMREREIRFIPIPKKSDVVHFTAKRLRRYIMDDLGKPTLKQRAEESPQVAYMLEAYIMKMFHGMQRMGMMADAKGKMTDQIPFVSTMTFSEAGENLQKLHAAGIDKILTQSVGWNPRGHDGMWPSRFPIEPRIGGEKGFRELIELGNKLGYQINVHDNYISQYKTSPMFDPEIVMYDQWGQADLRGFWGGGETYVTWPTCLNDDRLGKQMEKVKALGIQGMFYIDGIGNPLERNYHPIHRRTRSDYADGIAHILDEARRIFGAIGTECGFLYSTIPADTMAQCGNEWQRDRWDPDWPIVALRGPMVPVWQMAMHGLIVRENHGVDWKNTMECILYGDHPRDEWSERPDFMPKLDESRIAALKSRYDLCLKRFGYLQTLELTTLSGDENVQQATFEDGTQVTADWSKKELIVNKERIECPKTLQNQ